MQLQIIESFASIQGETSWAGLPTYFIRLARCNLRCTWCDTTYSFERGETVSIKDLEEKVHNAGCPYVCITGGEPLLQKEVYLLMTNLLNSGYRLSLETGGSLPTDKVDPKIKIILDIKCPASQMADKNHWHNLSLLRPHDEVKFVIQDRADYQFALEVVNRYRIHETAQVLFSPVFGHLDPQQLVHWILEDRAPVRLNLQLHKWIWTPTTRGV